MEMGTYTEAATELIPAGIYTVRLDNIEVVDKNPTFVEEGQDAKQWKWSWCLMDGAAKGKSLTSWSNRTINRGSTAKPWVEALLGRTLTEGESLDSDSILEQTMKVYISEHTTQAGKVVNRIKDVIGGPAAPTAPNGAQPTPTRDLSVGDLREYRQLRGELLELGADRVALDEKCLALLGGKEFPAATQANKSNLLQVLADWVTNYEAWGPDGDISFDDSIPFDDDPAPATAGKK
jgi:hypothetical protein